MLADDWNENLNLEIKVEWRGGFVFSNFYELIWWEVREFWRSGIFGIFFNKYEKTKENLTNFGNFSENLNIKIWQWKSQFSRTSLNKKLKKNFSTWHKIFNSIFISGMIDSSYSFRFESLVKLSENWWKKKNKNLVIKKFFLYFFYFIWKPPTKQNKIKKEKKQTKRIKNIEFCFNGNEKFSRQFFLVF